MKLGGIAAIIMFLSLFVIMIIVMRFVGAWMFRIDEIIKNQYKIIQELKQLNNKQE